MEHGSIDTSNRVAYATYKSREYACAAELMVLFATALEEGMSIDMFDRLVDVVETSVAEGE